VHPHLNPRGCRPRVPVKLRLTARVRREGRLVSSDPRHFGFDWASLGEASKRGSPSKQRASSGGWVLHPYGSRFPSARSDHQPPAAGVVGASRRPGPGGAAVAPGKCTVIATERARRSATRGSTRPRLSTLHGLHRLFDRILFTRGNREHELYAYHPLRLPDYPDSNCFRYERPGPRYRRRNECVRARTRLRIHSRSSSSSSSFCCSSNARCRPARRATARARL
jgi:hypothetical protein